MYCAENTQEMPGRDRIEIRRDSLPKDQILNAHIWGHLFIYGLILDLSTILAMAALLQLCIVGSIMAKSPAQ